MINSRDINYLHPAKVRPGYETLKNRVKDELGLEIILTSTGRDDEYQASLYAKGRTKPGSIVTYMKQTGAHGLRECEGELYCLAFDIVIVINGKAVWSHPAYQQIGRIGEELGFFWGGRWSTLNDVYHFQMTDGLTPAQLRAGQRPSWWHIRRVDYADHWGENVIIEALGDGILSGYPDGTFRPDDVPTRAQLAQFWHNVKKYIYGKE